MFVCDRERVRYANTACARLLGYPDPTQLDGLNPIDDMVVAEDRPTCRAVLSPLLAGEAGSAPHCCRLLRADGGVVRVHAMGQAYDDPGGRRILVTMIPNTADEGGAQRQAPSHDRDLIEALREVHHRMKNTLQVATDILTLQADASDSREATEALDKVARRIRALGAVHDTMSARQDVSQVDVRPLLQAVAGGLRGAAALTGEIVALTVDADETSVPSREASALALIAGELISNALSHTRATECTVRYVASGSECLLEVADNGTDEVEPDEIQANQELGLQLVRLLAEEQLGGAFSLQRTDGVTRACVRFIRKA
jgi:two-component sensor histidine kinase